MLAAPPSYGEPGPKKHLPTLREQGKTELVLRMLRQYPGATAADMAGYVDFYLPSDPTWPELEARCAPGGAHQGAPRRLRRRSR